MGRKETFEAIFWVAIAGVICLQSFRLDLGMVSRPGPGFMPFVAGAIIALLGGALFLQTIVMRRESEVKEEKIAFNFKSLIKLLSIFGVYTIVLYPLGYLISTFLLMLALFSIGKEKRKWWLIRIVAPLVVTTMSYLIFRVWLQCPLPKGMFTGI
jgi:hypothetical protein